MMQKAEQAAQQQRRRALVADDDPIMRSLLRSRLALLVDEVVEAAEGLEAWHLLSGECFDLAIVDLMMPGLDGFGLIGCLRGHPRTRHMPIVVVTSMNDRESIERALEAGASSFMTKPLAWSTFNAHVGHLMRLSTAAEAAEQRMALASAEAAAAHDAFRDLAETVSNWLAGLGSRLGRIDGKERDCMALAGEAGEGERRMRDIVKSFGETRLGRTAQRLDGLVAAAAWDAQAIAGRPVKVRLEHGGGLMIGGAAARRAIGAWLVSVVGSGAGEGPIAISAACVGETIELRPLMAAGQTGAEAMRATLPAELDRLVARLAARTAGGSLEEMSDGLLRLALPAAPDAAADRVSTSAARATA